MKLISTRHWLLLVPTAALLAAACSKEPLERPAAGGPLSFEIAAADGWKTAMQTRAAEDAADEGLHAGVFTLQGENPADTLFLHAAVAEGIASKDEDAQAGDRLQTRAAPVGTTTMYDSFGVLAYVFTGGWDEASCLPDYMYDVEITKASSWTASYYWPGAGRNIRFFAYAPYKGDGIRLSERTQAGAPSLAYTVPEAVADQKDLLVAATPAMAGNTSAAVPLTFSHALSAVRFTTGGDMLAGSIAKITLKGVYGSAAYTLGTDSWDAYGAAADFSQTLSVSVDGSADQPITLPAATFMMLPQTLPSGAAVEVVYRDELSGTDRKLTGKIDGQTWEMGKTYTYRLSTSSISVTPSFNVTQPADWTYQGGTKSNAYTVASYNVVRGPNSSGSNVSTNVPLAWTTEFFAPDDSGNYTVKLDGKPAWLTFTGEGSGAASAQSFSAAVSAQTSRSWNPHDDRLRAASPVSGTYNLSNASGGAAVQNTANCYIINVPGAYSLPLVYGNAVRNGATNASAYSTSASASSTDYTVLTRFTNHLGQPITNPYIYNNSNCSPSKCGLIWQDAKDLLTDVKLSGDGKSLLFTVGQSAIRQGNAVVAVYDSSNRVMWSWHIWVTDYVPNRTSKVEASYDPAVVPTDKAVTNYQNRTYTFMGVNLGWCNVASTAYDARSVMVRFTQTQTGLTQDVIFKQTAHYVTNYFGSSPYYQFGRKDPLLPSAGSSNANKTWYNASGVSSSGFATGSWTVGNYIANSIMNPAVFCREFRGKMCSNLWSANNTVLGGNDNTVVKTVYDPSPVGYKMPPSNAFTGFTTSGQNSSASSEFNTAGWNNGWNFYCRKNKAASGGIINFPALGARSYTSGDLGSVGISYYWTAIPYILNSSIAYSCSLGAASTYIGVVNNDSYFGGFPVRPVRE